MIRPSWPEDTPEIARLALAQYQRTPWPPDMEFPEVKAFLVNWHAGHVAACCGYRWDGSEIRVMHVWSEDGFRGRRAAVELMLHLEASADAEGSDLVFTVRPWNIGLRNAVEEHDCEYILGGDPGIAAYRRKARAWAAV